MWNIVQGQPIIYHWILWWCHQGVRSLLHARQPLQQGSTDRQRNKEQLHRQTTVLASAGASPNRRQGNKSLATLLDITLDHSDRAVRTSTDVLFSKVTDRKDKVKKCVYPEGAWESSLRPDRVNSGLLKGKEWTVLLRSVVQAVWTRGLSELHFRAYSLCECLNQLLLDLYEYEARYKFLLPT